MNVLQPQARLQQRLRQLSLNAGQVRRKLPSIGYVGVVLALILLTLLVGMIAALGSVELSLVMTGLLVLIPVILFVNLSNMLPLLFVMVFIIQGLGQTVLHMRLASWMASGFCGLFLAKALLGLFSLHSWRGAPAPAPLSTRLVLLAVYLYLGFFFFSLSLGHATIPQLISTLRFGLPIFGVLFALYWFPWHPKRLTLLWMLMLAITVLQLPVVVYQHFFLISADGWDSVVGSFGTGMSPILVMFVLTSFLYCLARWDRGLLPGWLVGVVFVIVMAVILLGEVKAAILWMPIGVFVVLRRRLKNPLVFVTYGIFLMLFVAGTFLAYKTLYWGDKQGGGNTIAEKYDNTSGYVFDTRVINYQTGEVSRGASLALWYRDPLPSTLERLVGYGPGASATSQSTGKGVVAARYRTLQLGATAIAQLLWDVGILGTLAFVAILVTGIAAGWQLGRRNDLPPAQMAIADASLAAMVLFLSTLIYNRGVLDEPPVQLLLYFCLGCLLQLSRFGVPQAGATGVPLAAVAPASTGLRA